MAMTKTQAPATRKMVLRFAEPLATTESEALQSALLQLEGSTKVDYVGAQLTIEYTFPLSCQAEIWALTRKLVEPGRFAFFDRLRYTLSAFAEQNEKDHRLYPHHWHTCVEDIHAHYFDYWHPSNSDTHKHLWRRYQKKSAYK